LRQTGDGNSAAASLEVVELNRGYRLQKKVDATILLAFSGENLKCFLETFEMNDGRRRVVDFSSARVDRK